EVDRRVRKLPGGEGHGALAVLDAREAFFLGGGDDGAVVDQRGGGIVIGGVDPERVQGGSALRWAGGRARSTTTPDTENRAPVRCRRRACVRGRLPALSRPRIRAQRVAPAMRRHGMR